MRLEPLAGRHASTLFPILDDVDVYRYESGDPHRDVASLRRRYERTARGPSDPLERWWNWALVVCDSTAPVTIGTVEISLVEGGRRALLGYAIGRAYWGLGYAFEASTAAIAYVRQTAMPLSIEAFVDTRNARSIALLERLGFARIAFLPENDTVCGVLADDYQYRLDVRKDDHGTYCTR